MSTRRPLKRLGSTFLLLTLLSVACGSRATQVPTKTKGSGVLMPPPWTSTPKKKGVSPSTLIHIPEPSLTVTSTHMPIPTRTTTRTQILTPFPTPSTPLSAKGPWLLGSTGRQLAAMNPDGTGLTALNILTRTWSTTGWVAARVYSNWYAPSDVSIRLLHLPSEIPVQTIRLLSDELATPINESDEWDIYLAPDVYQAILTERATILWSPDGRYLAFIAAIDGPSSDLYIYDTQTDQVRRLTDGPNQAVLIDWSLDGKWIIYMEATDFFTGIGGFAWHFSPKAVWAASVDGSEVKKLYDVEDGMELLMGWRAPSVFVALTSYGVSPPSNLRSVSVNSGRVDTLDRRDVTRVAADWKTGTVLYVVEHVKMGVEERGLFLFQPGWGAPTKLDTEGWGLPDWVEWLPDTGLFYSQFPRGTMIINPSGDVLRRIEAECIPVPSPDGQWLAFGRWDCPYGSDAPHGLRLYTSSGEFVRALSNERVDGPIWRPDSTGLFFNESVSTGDGAFPRLMYASIPEGEPWVVHSNPGASFFAWVEP